MCIKSHWSNEPTYNYDDVAQEWYVEEPQPDPWHKPGVTWEELVKEFGEMEV